MRIGIDGNEANLKKRVGIGEYAFELLAQFKKFKAGDINFTIYLKTNPVSDLPPKRDGWDYQIVGPGRLWTQIGLPLNLYLHKPRPDVFFTPTHYAPRFSPVPTVVSVMDLSYLHYPKLFKQSDLYQLRNWTAYSVKQARKVFTISRASKNDIIKYYQIKPERIVVTYPGYKFKNTMQSSKLLTEKYGIKGSYILFVGTVQPRKNLVRLIEAFSRIKRDSSSSAEGDIQLVIVGKKGWLYEEIYEAPKKFGVEDKIKFLNYVPDEDLPVLYKNAHVFVLPSLYEGFGLPVLEAMAQGCPVVISNTSSLPEVGGDAAVYIDPENVESIVEGIEKVLGDTKYRQSLIKKGREQVKKFSWEKTARETLKVLEEVAKEGR